MIQILNEQTHLGNLVFDPNQSERKIMIPIIAPPTDGPASFKVQLTEVRGTGQLDGQTTTEVMMEAAESKRRRITCGIIQNVSSHHVR